MRTFYKIPRSALNNWTEIMAWLYALPKTKRGKNGFIFSNVGSNMISFTWKRDATAFALKFGATPYKPEKRSTDIEMMVVDIDDFYKLSA